eukprot:13705573-Alexandrium_andersonii.AAC.1
MLILDHTSELLVEGLYASPEHTLREHSRSIGPEQVLEHRSEPFHAALILAHNVPLVGDHLACGPKRSHLVGR